MKQLKFFVLLLPLVLAAVGCSQDADTVLGNAGTETKSIHIALNTETRAGTGEFDQSKLRPDLHQQVNSVTVYIFDEEGRYVDEEKVDWSDMETKKTVEKNCVLGKLEKDKTYQLLGVGMDKNAASRFRIDVSQGLEACEAQLSQSGKVDEIGKCQIFAGTLTYPNPEGENVLDMYRRMAGVAFYISNEGLPDGTAYFRILLPSGQNTAVLLKKKDAADYGSGPSQGTGGNILVDSEYDSGEEYQNPYAYVLPFQGQASQDVTTLTLQVLDSEKKVLKSYDVLLGDERHYDLLANHLYMLGTSDNPVELPADSGNDLIITDWIDTEEEILDYTNDFK